MPFDAVLGTILYSPDRKLAIVNGRIEHAGDADVWPVDMENGQTLLLDLLAEGFHRLARSHRDRQDQAPRPLPGRWIPQRS